MRIALTAPVGAIFCLIGVREWLHLFYATQIGYKNGNGVDHYEHDRICAMPRPAVKP